MRHKTFGPPIRDWNQNRVIRPRAKILAVSLILCSLVLSWLRIPDTKMQLKVVLALVLGGSITFILTRNSR